MYYFIKKDNYCNGILIGYLLYLVVVRYMDLVSYWWIVLGLGRLYLIKLSGLMLMMSLVGEIRVC